MNRIHKCEKIIWRDTLHDAVAGTGNICSPGRQSIYMLNDVLLDLDHHFCDRDLASGDLARSGGAYSHTIPAEYASVLGSDWVSFLGQSDRALRASVQTRVAPDAQVLPIEDFRGWSHTLGIVAPYAIQRTSL